MSVETDGRDSTGDRDGSDQDGPELDGPEAAGPGVAGPGAPARREPESWKDGRAGLILAVVMVAYSTYLLYGILTMDLPEDGDLTGPAFFPTVLTVAGYVLAALLAVAYWRNPEPVDRESYKTYTDYAALGWCVAGFVIFALTLETVGWVIAAALLFWCVTRGIGSRRPLFDASVALLVSSSVYLIFGGVLGLNLPPGFLAGVL